MAERPERPNATHEPEPERRGFFSKVSSVAMGAGLIGGYGAFAAIAGRFMYPAKPDDGAWTFVSDVRSMRPGDSLLFRSPAGETINVTRKGPGATGEAFVALSSVCPHLGCQVHWEPHNDRYFCPCHNGVFDAAGRATEGPPAEAGQTLSTFPLKVEGGMLFIRISSDTITADADSRGEVIERVDGVHGPGHDPCLVADRRPRFGRKRA